MNQAFGMIEEQLADLASSFEHGTGDRSDYGEPGRGRPAAFGEVMRSVTFEEAPSTIAAMDERAAKLGKSRSDYLRSLVAKDPALA